jgi:hypothetical protein
MSVLETIIRDAKVEFLIAKHDGVLEASEVIHIGLNVAKKVFALANLSEEEKDAMVILCLKKGLAAAGGLSGLPGLAALPPAALDAVEEQLLKAGVGAAHAMRKAAPALFAPVKKALLGCLPYCSLVASVMDPKDAAVLHEAVQVLTPVQAIQEEPAQTDAPRPAAPVEDIPLPNTPDVAPNPAASQKASP